MIDKATVKNRKLVVFVNQPSTQQSLYVSQHWMNIKHAGPITNTERYISEGLCRLLAGHVNLISPASKLGELFVFKHFLFQWVFKNVTDLLQ